MGVAKLAEAAIIIAIAKGKISTWRFLVIAKAMGNIKAAAALLVIISVKKVVIL
jgi:hypothetical protein